MAGVYNFPSGTTNVGTLPKQAPSYARADLTALEVLPPPAGWGVLGYSPVPPSSGFKFWEDSLDFVHWANRSQSKYDALISVFFVPQRSCLNAASVLRKEYLSASTYGEVIITRLHWANAIAFKTSHSYLEWYMWQTFISLVDKRGNVTWSEAINIANTIVPYLTYNLRNLSAD